MRNITTCIETGASVQGHANVRVAENISAMKWCHHSSDKIAQGKVPFIKAGKFYFNSTNKF